MSNKIFDCITFFNENLITNTRFEILHEIVDYFVVCESIYDHRGQKKKLNFKLINEKYKSKIIYIVLEDKFESQNLWKNQAKQREFIFEGLKRSNDDDYIMFSDPDEIPRPEILNNFKLTKKYGIFFQKCFCYKINIFNQFETPWEGTRIVKFKNLSSIDYLRQKIVAKNLSARRVEILVRSKKGPQKSGQIKIDANILNEERRIQDNLGLNIKIENKKNNSGKITSLYKNLEQFELVSNLLKRN